MLDGFALRVFGVRLRPLLQQTNHLVNLGRKQIERGHNGTVGPEVVVLHYILVLD